MKQLLRKPFFFAVLLSLPLWVVLNNYLIAFISALLIAFMASMCYSLYVVKRRAPEPAPSDLTQAAIVKNQQPLPNSLPSDSDNPHA